MGNICGTTYCSFFVIGKVVCRRFKKLGYLHLYNHSNKKEISRCPWKREEWTTAISLY